MASENPDNTGRGSDEEGEGNNGFDELPTLGRSVQPGISSLLILPALTDLVEAHQVQDPYQAVPNQLNQSHYLGAGGYIPPPTSAPPRFTGGLNPQARGFYPGGEYIGSKPWSRS